MGIHDKQSTLGNISARRTPDVSAKQVCLYLAENMEEVKRRAKRRICQEIDSLTLEELYDVFWSGREQYGGEFDVEAIPCNYELKREACDVTWYVNFLLHQVEK